MVLLQASKTLIPLGRLQLLTRLPATHRSEITVYIKGFLAQGEQPRNFDRWLHSHHLLALSPTHDWDGLSFGYSWLSGIFPHVTTMPVPVSTLISGAMQLVRLKKLTPLGFATMLTVDTTLNIGRLAYQYYNATRNADERAHHLAGILANLRTEYSHVRVVCHSLGSRHLVSALAQLSSDQLPDTVHMCAAAMTESFVEPYFHRLARERVYVYWTSKDTVLGTIFRVMSKGESALGHVGVQGQYQGVESVDVSSYFGMALRTVHTGYAVNFHRFARELRGQDRFKE